MKTKQLCKYLLIIGGSMIPLSIIMLVFGISMFTNYALRQKADFGSLSVSKKQIFIEQSVQKDAVLKNTFIGMTIGMFTLEEMEVYQSDSKVFNKRIITILIERLKSQIEKK